MALQIGDNEASDPIFLFFFFLSPSTSIQWIPHWYQVLSSWGSLIFIGLSVQKEGRANIISYNLLDSVPKKKGELTLYPTIKLQRDSEILVIMSYPSGVTAACCCLLYECRGDTRMLWRRSCCCLCRLLQGFNSFSPEFSVYVVLCYRNKPVNEQGSTALRKIYG